MGGIGNTGNMGGTLTDARAIVAQSDLSERQQLFIFELLRGRNKTEAALAAGYREGSAGHVLRHAGVQRVLAACMDRFLVGELAPTAFGVVNKLMIDEKTPAGVRATLALGVLDRAGFGAKRHEKQAGEGKDVAQMSADELRQAIDKLQAEIDGRMHDVTPDSGPDDSQLAEIYP